MNIGQIGEDALIQRYIKPIASNIGDDCGLIPGSKLVTSVDSQVENTHFLRRFPARGVGYKALASAFSDLTASGASPVGVLLALHLPEDLEMWWFEAMLGGIQQANEGFSCPLIGGNIARSKEIVISVTVFGETIQAVIERSGAALGDDVWVTGNPGISQAGLALLLEGKTNENHPWIQRHLYPPNRQLFIQELFPRVTPTAMLDLSDGLVQDLPRLNNASCQLQIDLDKIEAPQQNPEPFWIGGEDYELLFCAKPENRQHIESASKKSQTPVRKIGTCVGTDQPAFLLHKKPYSFQTKVYQHF